MHTIPAAVLDRALANISDVPEVETDEGLLVRFSGSYESPVNDLTEFLAALQRQDEEAAQAAREGLYFRHGGYAGYGEAVLIGLRIEGKSAYEPCDECREHGREGKTCLLLGDRFLCEDCREPSEAEAVVRDAFRPILGTEVVDGRSLL